MDLLLPPCHHRHLQPQVAGGCVADSKSTARFNPLFEHAAIPPGQLILPPDRGPSIKAKVTALLLADPTTRITTISGIGLMTPDYGQADAAHAGRRFGDGRLEMRQTCPCFSLGEKNAPVRPQALLTSGPTGLSFFGSNGNMRPAAKKPPSTFSV